MLAMLLLMLNGACHDDAEADTDKDVADQQEDGATLNTTLTTIAANHEDKLSKTCKSPRKRVLLQLLEGCRCCSIFQL